MRIRVAIASIAVVALTLAAGAQSRPAQTLLEAARKMGVVDGNLNGAIKQYQAIVDTYGKTDRAAAATALVRMAEAYQKLGRSEARQKYEQVIRDYADQTAAVATARAALGESQTPTFAQVWAGSGVDPEGTISPDGRYLSYADWLTGNLRVRDLASGTSRPLTDGGAWRLHPRLPPDQQQFAQESAISKDGRLVAYSWFNGASKRFDLRVAPLQGPITPPRRLYDNPNVNWIGPFDWSPGGRWIAVQLARPGGQKTQIGIVSTGTGVLRVLKTVDQQGSSTLKFSPDGRWLAFDARYEQDGRVSHHISVLAVDESRETEIVTNDSNNRLMGWSPDGRWLLFTSDRRGSNDLWAMAVANGVPQGDEKLLKADVGGGPLGITTSGTLFVAPRMSTQDISVASVDLTTGHVVGAPVRPISTFVGTNDFPSWASDGKLVYLSRNRPQGGLVLAVRDLKTGRVHEVPVQLARLRNPHLAPDGASFIAQGADRTGRQGIYRIEAATGAATPVDVTPKRAAVNPVWSPDGQTIYYRRKVDGRPGQMSTWALIAKNSVSGTATELFRDRSIPAGGLAVSRDGRTIAITRGQAILAIPAGGGAPRTLATVDPPTHFNAPGLTWTPDGQHLVVIVREGQNSSPRVAIVPIDGSPIRKLDLDVTRQVRLSRDGRRIAYVSGQDKTFEVWKLEHFLPPAGASKER